MAKTPKNKNITTIIYSLEDPDTNEIRYIGKTVRSLSSRLTNHIYTAKKINNYRCNWIKSIVKKGKKPVIKILDSCNWDESAELEIYWITQFKSWGFNLVNSTEGGEGNLGFKLSKERRDKLTKAVSKKVYQYNLNGDFIKEFPSCSDAGRSLNLTSFSKIGLAARGKRAKAYNFQWSYDKVDKMPIYKRNVCISEKHKKILKKSRSIPILQCDLEGKLIKEWESAKVAALNLDITYTTFINYINGKNKTNYKMKKYIWRKK